MLGIHIVINMASPNIVTLVEFLNRNLESDLVRPMRDRTNADRGELNSSSWVAVKEVFWYKF